MPATHVLSTVRCRVSPLQWQARQDCAARHPFAQTGLMFNDVSLRVPGVRLLDRRDPGRRG
jgi:hypothetical protein